MSDYVFCNQCGSTNEVANKVKIGPDLYTVTFKDCGHRQRKDEAQ